MKSGCPERREKRQLEIPGAQAQDHEQRRSASVGRGGKYAKPSKECEEKRKEWAKHWQCNREMQVLEERPWRNEEFRILEEGAAKKENEEKQRGVTWPLLAWTVAVSLQGSVGLGTRIEGRNCVVPRTSGAVGDGRNNLARRCPSRFRRT